MILYRKLWNFDLLWKILWYYGKNYGTIVNYSYHSIICSGETAQLTGFHQ